MKDLRLFLTTAVVTVVIVFYALFSIKTFHKIHVLVSVMEESDVLRK